MKSTIKSRFTPEIQVGISKHFGIDPISSLQDLNGFENFVYAFEHGDTDRILRIGHSLRRPEHQVRSEIEWLRFLAENNAGVAAPVGEIKSFDDGHGAAFVAAVFEKAEGTHPEPEVKNARFYEIYGATIGRLHAVTKRFQPSAEFSRPTWSEETREVETNLPSDDEAVRHRVLELREKLEQLPTTEDWYGLIHQDPHTGNLHRDDRGRITLFDFDDCVFGHYIYDIAMVFFYAGFRDDDPAEPTRRFFADFMRGYNSEHELPDECFSTIPLFMKLREIDLYAVVHRSFDPDKPIESKFMEGRRDSIAEGIPWMDFDFQRSD